MQKGITEIKEMLTGIEVVAVAVKKIMADGKVTLEDAQHVLELSRKMEVLIAAIVGLKDVPAEAKDIQADEALEIVAACYALVNKIQAA